MESLKDGTGQLNKTGLLLRAVYDGKEFNKAVFKIIRFSLKLSVCPKRQAVQHTLLSLQGERSVGRQVCGPGPRHHMQANKERGGPTSAHCAPSL